MFRRECLDVDLPYGSNTHAQFPSLYPSGIVNDARQADGMSQGHTFSLRDYNVRRRLTRGAASHEVVPRLRSPNMSCMKNP